MAGKMILHNLRDQKGVRWFGLNLPQTDPGAVRAAKRHVKQRETKQWQKEARDDRD